MPFGDEGDAGTSKANANAVGLPSRRSRSCRSTATKVMGVAACPLRPAPSIRRSQLLSLAITKRRTVAPFVETRRT